MNRTIEYVAVTLLVVGLTMIAALGASRYISAQFGQATATIEARQ